MTKTVGEAWGEFEDKLRTKLEEHARLTEEQRQANIIKGALKRPSDSTLDLSRGEVSDRAHEIFSLRPYENNN